MNVDQNQQIRIHHLSFMARVTRQKSETEAVISIWSVVSTLAFGARLTNRVHRSVPEA